MKIIFHNEKKFKNKKKFHTKKEKKERKKRKEKKKMEFPDHIISDFILVWEKFLTDAKISITSFTRETGYENEVGYNLNKYNEEDDDELDKKIEREKQKKDYEKTMQTLLFHLSPFIDADELFVPSPFDNGEFVIMEDVDDDDEKMVSNSIQNPFKDRKILSCKIILFSKRVFGVVKKKIDLMFLNFQLLRNAELLDKDNKDKDKDKDKYKDKDKNKNSSLFTIITRDEWVRIWRSLQLMIASMVIFQNKLFPPSDQDNFLESILEEDREKYSFYEIVWRKWFSIYFNIGELSAMDEEERRLIIISHVCMLAVIYHLRNLSFLIPPEKRSALMASWDFNELREISMNFPKEQDQLSSEDKILLEVLKGDDDEDRQYRSSISAERFIWMNRNTYSQLYKSFSKQIDEKYFENTSKEKKPFTPQTQTVPVVLVTPMTITQSDQQQKKTQEQLMHLLNQQQLNLESSPFLQTPSSQQTSNPMYMTRSKTRRRRPVEKEETPPSSISPIKDVFERSNYKSLQTYETTPMREKKK